MGYLRVLQSSFDRTSSLPGELPLDPNSWVRKDLRGRKESFYIVLRKVEVSPINGFCLLSSTLLRSFCCGKGGKSEGGGWRLERIGKSEWESKLTNILFCKL